MKLTSKTLDRIAWLNRDLPSGPMEYSKERCSQSKYQHLLHVPDPTPGEDDLIVEILIDAWLPLGDSHGEAVTDHAAAEAIGKWVAEMWVAAPAMVAEIKRLREANDRLSSLCPDTDTDASLAPADLPAARTAADGGRGRI
jgi:hypothetical protein